MKLFKIWQNFNTGYDTYSDAIVCAEDEDEAKTIHPNGDEDWNGKEREYGTWCDIKHVHIEYIGEASKDIKKGVILASFHAG